MGDVWSGRATWNDYQVDVGNGAQQLSQSSPAWNFAFNHPYATGALTGLVSTAAAITGVDAVGAFGAASYPGVGTAYATKQLVAGTVYSALTLGTLGSIPGTIGGLGGVNYGKPSSFLSTALSLSFTMAVRFPLLSATFFISWPLRDVSKPLERALWRHPHGLACHDQ